MNLRSLYCYGGLVAWSALFVIAGAAPVLVGLALAKDRDRFLQRVIVVYGRVITRVAWWPVVRVRFEDLSPETRGVPAIYVFNHRSASDPFLLSALNITMIQIVNGWPMRLPFFGFFARHAGYLNAVTLPFEEMRERIRRTLAAGSSVGSFPEGTRSESPAMNPFRSGIFRIAKAAQAPLIPCCITGNEFMPDRRFVFRKSGVIHVCRGRPVPADWVRDDSPYVLKRKVQQVIAELAGRYEKETR